MTLTTFCFSMSGTERYGELWEDCTGPSPDADTRDYCGCCGRIFESTDAAISHEEQCCAEHEEARAQGITVEELREAHRQYDEAHTPTVDEVIDGVIGRAAIDPAYFDR